MSAKLLRAGGEQMLSRHHIAIGNIVFPQRELGNCGDSVFVSGQQAPERIAAAAWVRLRQPCRRAEWWR